MSKKNVFQLLEEDTILNLSQTDLDRIKRGVVSKMSTMRFATEIINLYTEPLFAFASDVLVQSGQAFNESINDLRTWIAIQLKVDGKSAAIDAAALLFNLRSRIRENLQLQILLEEADRLTLGISMSKQEEYNFFESAKSGHLLEGIVPVVDHLGYFSSLEELKNGIPELKILAALRSELKALIQGDRIKDLFDLLEKKLKEGSALLHEVMALKTNYQRIESQRGTASLPPNLYQEEMQTLNRSLVGVVNKVYPGQLR